MPESIRNCQIAYTKGVNSKGQHCPYGDTKLQLKHWWESGVADALLCIVDSNFIIKDLK
jgi:hypothetical protein|tara:strand:+ start:210 stop:386 length:177 start_codon:yes stop_codon:yes gene_type:complete